MNVKRHHNLFRFITWKMPVTQLFLLLIMTAILASTGCSARHAAKPLDVVLTPPLDLSDAWGVELTQASLTAAGIMVDVRLRVADPEKARELFSEKTKPRMIDEQSGRTFSIPTPAYVGQMRQTTMTPQQGRVYFMFFGNTDRSLVPGSLVTLIIGDMTIEHIAIM